MVQEYTSPQEVTQKAVDSTKQLSFAEAAQVYAVLKATLDRLGLVGVITVDPQEQAMVLTQSVGEEISLMINEQRELEKQFEVLIGQQHILHNAPNRMKAQDNDARLKVVAEKLRTSIKQLCDKLKDNPNVAENMAKIASERQQLQMLLNKTLEELNTGSKVPSISETVYGEHHRQQEMRDIVDRERTTTRTVTQLRLELKDEKEEHEKMTRTQRARVANLKQELQVQNQATYVEQAHTAKHLHAANERDSRIETHTVSQLEHTLDQLQRKILLEEYVHQAASDFFKASQAELCDTSVEWGDRTKTDGEAQEHQVNVLKSRHKAALAEAKELEKLYQKELMLQQQRDMQAREKEEQAAMDTVTAAQKGKAAAVIQAHWRGRMVREAAKGGKGGKKAKGKKKK